ncbi:unnamed protein product [Calicophoron daubneyi]|uniref:Nucleoporin SEH1 n=1 Tax=Calicophoron daubneyi TaxID=300641 RepID=A0AAV2TSB5_CALDB
MFVSRSIHANHADLIHDVAYDFYGRRMATCSSDQMIKIWDLRADGEWICTARWRCHLGSAWRVTWAHPEFGQVIATCSFDRTIAIWEEVAGAQPVGYQALHDADGQTTTPAPGTTNLSTPLSSGTSWVRRANLVDPRTSVTGLQFAPRHLGLQLAAISTDGLLRIYEALDVMNLSQWRLQFDFGTKMTGSCLAWSQSRLDPPLIAVGSSSPVGPPSSQDNLDGTQAPSSTVQSSTTSMVSLVSGKVVIYEYSDARRHWDLVEDIKALEDAVYDLQFAPHMGQSYHTLAVASKDVYILRIRPASSHSFATAKGDNTTVRSALSSGNSERTRTPYEIDLMARFDHHKGRVWRVSWNVTGSMLASSGDDGCVRLWQANHLGVWLPVSVISPDGSQSTSVPSALQDEVRPKLGLSSMIPQLVPPMRTVGSSTQIKSVSMVGESDPAGLAKPTSERQGSTTSATNFQKLGTLGNGSHPVAWH